MTKGILVLLGMVVAGVAGWVTFTTPTTVGPAEAPVSVTSTSTSLIQQRVQTMTLDEKIGQVLMVGIPGPTLDAATKAFLHEGGFGGVILFSRNIKDRAQVTQLIQELQANAPNPLFIAVDQEGGVVTRLKFLNELTAQSKIKTAEQAETVGRARAKELHTIGFTMNFSPVLDLTTKTSSYLFTRTFGLVGAEKTGELGAAMVRGSHAEGVLSVAKHYPGYGDIALDPHQKEVVLRVTDAAFATQQKPFQTVLAADPMAPIMLAHIIIPSVDTLPATRSPAHYQALRQLGAKGLLVTDDLEMVSVGVAADVAAVDAIRAGADVAMVAHTRTLQAGAIAGVRRAVEEGSLSLERLDDAVTHVLEAKERVGLK